MSNITIESVYKKIVLLQRDVAQIKKTLLEEPELREDYILRMRDIELEKSLIVEDFEFYDEEEEISEHDLNDDIDEEE